MLASHSRSHGPLPLASTTNANNGAIKPLPESSAQKNEFSAKPFPATPVKLENRVPGTPGRLFCSPSLNQAGPPVVLAHPDPALVTRGASPLQGQGLQLNAQGIQLTNFVRFKMR